MGIKPQTVEEITKKNIEVVKSFEEASQEGRSRSEKAVDQITALCSTVGFAWFNAGVFLGWIVANQFLLKKPFDPYPFTFLITCVSLEAIFLSLFILITQNRESEIESKRTMADLQINLLSEMENTKMLEMLSRIAKKLEVKIDGDPQVEVLAMSSEPEVLLAQIEELKT